MPFQKGNKLGGRTHGARKKPDVWKLFFNEFLGAFKDDTFYVYAHEVNGVCFYIGKGKGNRAWEKKRNEIWDSFVLSIGNKYDIRIMAANLTEDEAFAIERELITLKNPKCNINCTQLNLKVV